MRLKIIRNQWGLISNNLKHFPRISHLRFFVCSTLANNTVTLENNKICEFCYLLNYLVSVLFVGRVWLRRSFPPGLDEALPYQIIPATAMIIPKTTWRLRPSFPKKKNPMIKTSIVFICPSTWKETAVNLPMQINWLRLVPTAIVHDRNMKICQNQDKDESVTEWKC